MRYRPIPDLTDIDERTVMPNDKVPDIFSDHISRIDDLRALVPEPSLNITYEKVLTQLDDHCRALISASPYVVLATCDDAGRCDASPRGGRPGFVAVLDDHCLLIPELSGNRRADSLRNIILNPRIGLYFLIPGYEDILRLNGQAYVIDNPALLEPLAIDGKQPIVGIGVRIVEAYMHCAKSAKRASLWNPDGWPELSDIPPMAQILKDHTRGKVGDGSVDAIQDLLDESYSKRLFEPGW